MFRMTQNDLWMVLRKGQAASDGPPERYRSVPYAVTRPTTTKSTAAIRIANPMMRGA